MRILPVVTLALVLVWTIAGCAPSESPQPSPALAPAAIGSGDVNQDGSVSMGDVAKVERIILGLDPPTPSADVNGDGVIDMSDVTKIERIILGRN
jgi:hypothetical protein